MSTEIKFIFNELRCEGFKCKGNTLYKNYGRFCVCFGIQKSVFEKGAIFINFLIVLNPNLDYEKVIKNKNNLFFRVGPESLVGFGDRLPISANRYNDYKSQTKFFESLLDYEQLLHNSKIAVTDKLKLRTFNLNNAIEYIKLFIHDATLLKIFIESAYKMTLTKGEPINRILEKRDMREHDSCLCYGFECHDFGMYDKAIKLYEVYLSFNLNIVDEAVINLLNLAKKKESPFSLLPKKFQEDYFENRQ